jgi:hypothetical protein
MALEPTLSIRAAATELAQLSDAKLQQTRGVHVELKGNTSPRDGTLASALRAPFTNTPCLRYSIQIVRVWEEFARPMVHDPMQPQRMLGGGGTWINRTEILKAAQRSVPMYLSDASIEEEKDNMRVRVLDVDVKLPELEVETLNTFKPHVGAQHGGVHGVNPFTLSFGAHFVLPVSAWALAVGAPQRRIVGYRFLERGVPVRMPTYALGSLLRVPGEGLILRKAAGEPFAFSFKSEHELQRIVSGEGSFLHKASFASAAFGVASLLWHAVNRYSK